MTRIRNWSRLLVLAMMLPLAAACEITPEPVHIGAEECAHCSMLITDRRYAAQLLTSKGRAYKFDAVECLHAFVRGGAVAAAETHSLWVTDAGDGESWVRADEATFIHSAELRTPMGGGLAAYASPADAREAAVALKGHVLDWAALIATELPGHGHDHAANNHGAGDHTAHDHAAHDHGTADHGANDHGG